MVKKLIHIADIHIRTFQLHDLYRNQFEILIQNLKKETKEYNYEEIRVVIVGDIVH